jgi:hypothetical protein
MSKQQIHIRIENSIYILLKSKNVNVSSLVNNLLKSYVDTEELEIPEETEIQKQIEEKTKLYKTTQDEINILSVMLAKAREERKIREKEEEELREEKHDLARQLFREHQMEKIRREANKRR